MEYTTDAVKIWFFNRTMLPDDIAAGKPAPPSKNGSDLHAWGKPTALFQHDSQSSLTTHLRDLQIIFDTTFCGDWAGKVWNQSSCASLAPTCEEYVSKNPRAFDETYWLIKSLQVYEKKEPSSLNSPSSPSNSTHNHSHKKITRRSLPAGLTNAQSGSQPEPEDLYLINTWIKPSKKSKTKKTHSKTPTPIPTFHDSKPTFISRRDPNPNPEPAAAAPLNPSQLSSLFSSYDRFHTLFDNEPLRPSTMNWQTPTSASSWTPQTHCETNINTKKNKTKVKCVTLTVSPTLTFPTFRTDEPAHTYNAASETGRHEW